MKFKNRANGTCFLSPHSDDISMSALYVILEKVLPEPYYLFTIFSSSEYVDISKVTEYLKDKITDTRLNEDRMFSKALDMTFLHLKEPDCLKRLGFVIYDSKQNISSSYVERLSNFVALKIKSYEISNIVVPYPFGEKQHYDHRITRCVAEKLSNNLEINLYYLDDIPYSVIDFCDNLEICYKKELNYSDIVHKIQFMDIYKSQMCDYFYERVKIFNKERILKNKWKNC
ncbi:MAG: hypothetical protein KDE33_06365 [Bacteroidetes bacterium]|nr:hypothetical protein [Bacteroidota bacterium]